MATGRPVTDDGLHRVIGFWGGLAVIVGTTIGSGVFRKPYPCSALAWAPRSRHS